MALTLEIQEYSQTADMEFDTGTFEMQVRHNHKTYSFIETLHIENTGTKTCINFNY
jgi:hypothetical protein